VEELLDVQLLPQLLPRVKVDPKRIPRSIILTQVLLLLVAMFKRVENDVHHFLGCDLLIEFLALEVRPDLFEVLNRCRIMVHKLHPIIDLGYICEAKIKTRRSHLLF